MVLKKPKEKKNMEDFTLIGSCQWQLGNSVSWIPEDICKQA